MPGLPLRAGDETKPDEVGLPARSGAEPGALPEEAPNPPETRAIDADATPEHGDGHAARARASGQPTPASQPERLAALATPSQPLAIAPFDPETLAQTKVHGHPWSVALAASTAVRWRNPMIITPELGLRLSWGPIFAAFHLDPTWTVEVAGSRPELSGLAASLGWRPRLVDRGRLVVEASLFVVVERLSARRAPVRDAAGDEVEAVEPSIIWDAGAGAGLAASTRLPIGLRLGLEIEALALPTFRKLGPADDVTQAFNDLGLRAGLILVWDE